MSETGPGQCPDCMLKEICREYVPNTNVSQCDIKVRVHDEITEARKQFAHQRDKANELEADLERTKQELTRERNLWVGKDSTRCKQITQLLSELENMRNRFVGMSTCFLDERESRIAAEEE